MRPLLEFFQLLWLNFVVQVFGILEQIKVMRYYYPNGPFARVDRLLLRAYFLDNPFQVCKRFLKKRGAKDVYTYGETPLTTFEFIVHQCGITEKDTFLELGSGRGRLCFWVYFFVKCKVFGIEEVPVFVERATHLNVSEVTFICGDYLKVEFPKASVVFLYGTNLDDMTLYKLIAKLKALGKGTKIISVSYPLTDYDSDITLLKSFKGRFPWGTTDIYLQN